MTCICTVVATRFLLLKTKKQIILFYYATFLNAIDMVTK
jgi:hypothetical protein